MQANLAIVIRGWVCLFVIFVSAAIAFAETPQEQPAPPLSPAAQAIKSEFEVKMKAAPSNAVLTRLKSMYDHYESQGFEPIWTNSGAAAAKAEAVVVALERADEHGLRKSDYQAEQLAGQLKLSPLPNPAATEVSLSTAFVAFAQHLNAGRLNPTAVTRENVIYPDRISAEELLQTIRKTSNVIPYLRLLAPRTPRYDRLRNALKAYRRIAENGGWPVVPKGETLKPGMSDPRLDILRARLTITGEYSAGEPLGPTDLYEGAIVEAVELFQKRHGLEVDGAIGPNTLKEINVTVNERIAIMEYNLERRRWMQNDYGQHYIFANLADQVVKVVKNNKTIYAEIIQVGLPYHKTPVFTDTMEHLEINPYWNVPYSIATRELLPKLKANPNAYTSQGYEVLTGGKIINASSVPWYAYSRSNFPVRIRQRPGPDNALGRIKFMFPNKHNVYIHDTPSKSKFNRASRFFSHGCLRLKDPLRLAEVLLKEQGWDRARIEAAVKSKKRRVVKLEKQIPVHIAYLTAWVNKDGSLHFRRDVYGRDKIMAKALEKVGS